MIFPACQVDALSVSLSVSLFLLLFVFVVFVNESGEVK